MKFILQTLGDLSLREQGGRSLAAPNLSLILLAYLFDVGRPVTRKHLANLLWPDRPEAASINLRSTLRRLSGVTNATRPLVASDDNSVFLDPQSLICDLDFSRFTDPASHLRASADAVAYKFLPLLGETRTSLDLWVRDVRARLASQLRTDLLRLHAHPDSDQIRSELKRAAVLLLEQEPGDEDVRRVFLPHLVPGEVPATTIERVPHRPARLPDQASAERTSASTLPPRIALLPPETSRDAQRHESIANAMIEDLTIDLCTSKAVSVVAPYTAERIRASSDKASILEKHSVIYALDTRRSEDHLFVQLIFMPTDEVVWAARFCLSPDKAAHNKLVISEAIRTSIFERVGSRSHHVEDFRGRPEAYFAYLRGLQSISAFNLPSIRKARRQFKEALDTGKGFSAARAGISRTLTMEWLLTARGDNDLLYQAEQQAKAAIAEDDRLAGAFKELGVSQLYIGKIDESLEALSQAESLGPSYADVLYSHADSLVHASNPKAALEKIGAAIALNPLSPDTYFWTAAGASYFLCEYRQALSYIARMRDGKPAAKLAAASWGMLGESAKARTCRMRVLKTNPDFDLERWLKMVPHKEPWQTELYREGLRKAGF